VFGGASGTTANVVQVPVNGGGINWDLSKSGIGGTDPPTLDVNKISAVGCSGDGFIKLVGFNDWANIHFNLRASLEFAGGADPEQAEVTTEQELAGGRAVDADGDGKPDGFQCGAPSPTFPDGLPCILDVKPGDPLNTSNLIAPLQGVLPAALLGSATFNPGRDVDQNTLTLAIVDGEGNEGAGHHVQLKPNGTRNCSTGDVSGPNADFSGATGVPDGFKDLLCKYDGVSFPAAGSFFVILRGNLNPPPGSLPGTLGSAIFARDIVNVSR
jgi:hypothetical protein